MEYSKAEALLKQKGYKLTGQRKVVFEVLAANKHEHLTSDEIHKLVRKINPNVGIATVYRTLLLFSELGLVQKLDIDDSGTRYELRPDEQKHNHHHLICSKCNKVEEVEDDLLEEVEEKINKAHGFKTNDHELKFYGICKECLEKEEKGEISG